MGAIAVLMRNCDADAKMMGLRIDLRGGRGRAGKKGFRCWFALHSCSEASSCRQGTVSPCGEAGTDAASEGGSCAWIRRRCTYTVRKA